MSGQKIQKIAIVRLSALGDIIHALPTLALIRAHNPLAHISWIVDEKFSPLLKGHQLIDEVVALPLKEKKFIKSFQILKHLEPFDAIIDLQGLVKSALVTLCLKGPSWGFGFNGLREKLAGIFYTHRVNIAYEANAIMRGVWLAGQACGFKAKKEDVLKKPPCLPHLLSPQNAKPNARAKVLIAPFASQASKCYDKFQTVILALSELNEVYVCHGNEAEKAKASELVSATQAKLLPSLDISQLATFLSQCDLVIGNDSGVTHLAWAQNIPSITLFGNRPASRNSFATPINLSISSGKKVDIRKIDDKDFSITNINPQDIIDLAKSLLKTSKDRL